MSENGVMILVEKLTKLQESNIEALTKIADILEENKTNRIFNEFDVTDVSATGESFTEAKIYLHLEGEEGKYLLLTIPFKLASAIANRINRYLNIGGSGIG